MLELVVGSGYRDKGIGTMLMNKLEEYFRESNCDTSAVVVFVPNKKAHRPYHKLGCEDRSVYMTKGFREQE